MRVLGLVTARGGSKGIPRKNIVPLCGRPLLAYTACPALAARRLQRVVLSTDDEEIATVGRAVGLEVPFLRPPELAGDRVGHVPVVQHAVGILEDCGDHFDAVMVLQPTSPLRLASDIDGSVELLEETGADSVISLARLGGWHPYKLKVIRADGRVEDPPYARGMSHVPRQELPEFLLPDGSIYLVRRDLLMLHGLLLGADTRAWITPEERAVNIDTWRDLLLAEALLTKCAVPQKAACVSASQREGD
ncbi:MAG: acylneuraminate cytidylyltransferase family protein [Acidobacteriota bacterium]